MDLHVTVAGGPGVMTPAQDIVVDTDVVTSGAALAERLEAYGWPAPFAVDGVPLAALQYPRTLHDGVVIIAGAPPVAPQRRAVPHLVLVVYAGPDAGQVFPLTRGSYSIGRADADLLIADPALSRPHARLTVSEDTIVLEDLGSVNGTFVDGEPIARRTVTVSARIHLGSSHCRIDLLDAPSWPGADPASVLEPVPVAPELPRKPSRVLVLTALLPLVFGVVLALTTGMWLFLAFSGLSAMTGLVPLLAYRRAAKVFGVAVVLAAEKDRRRRLLSMPDPGDTGLDALRELEFPDDAVAEGGAVPSRLVLLRLGTADQAAHLAVRGSGEHFQPPELSNMPLLVVFSGPPAVGMDPDLLISGDAVMVQGLARALLLQLAHPMGASHQVTCWGSVGDLPKSARFLPNVRLTKDPEVLDVHLSQPGPCLIFQFSKDIPLLSRHADTFVVRISPGAETATATRSVRLSGRRGNARIGTDVCDFEPDLVSDRTFARTARVLAKAAALRTRSSAARRSPPAVRGATALPSSVSLWSAASDAAGLASTALPAWRSSDPAHPTAQLGLSRQGPVVLDLVRDGPHLLVAGTTGSGKSELLRTLVLGLAMSQPPNHLVLLLIDYKGGAGLGELAALPQCVGSMSDLSSESTARAFVSLRAELRRRETICAEHGARDLEHLRVLAPASCPPRLAVVIDEFRMLIDEVPAAMPDLLKIAALGRSLGVHLILATQKAQGAVPPDMRANITSAVLLRVRTALESQDLLGSTSAADIPVDLPGRAYLRRGNEAPVEFQVATCSATPPPAEVKGWQDLDAYVDGNTPAFQPGMPSDTSPEMLGLAVQALLAAADRSDAEKPEPPVLPALPDRLTQGHCSELLPVGRATRAVDALGPGRDADGNAPVDLGVLDLPHHQVQRVLQWKPREHSHLAVIGLPGSGGSEAVAALVAALPGADPDTHLYLLDGDGSLSKLRSSVGDQDVIGRHLGALVEPQETRRAARVLERLAGLASSPADERRIVLAITGWGRWIAQFRGTRGCHAEEDLHAVVRDGALNGVTVLVLGDRELTASRFFSLIPNRVYLPLGAHQEITLTWPKMPPMDAVVGRAFSQGRINGSWGDAVCQLLLEPRVDLPLRRPQRAPFPVHPLPTVLPLSTLDMPPEHGHVGHDVEHGASVVALGVHGDDLEPYNVALDPGQVFLILGHPSSGRTNALRVFASSSPVRSGRRRVIAPPWGASPSTTEHFWRTMIERPPAGADLPRSLLLVDDAERLPADVQRLLSELVAAGATAVLATRPSPSLMTRIPLALQARSTGQGLILSPRTQADGDLLGVRVDVEGANVPGRGHAVSPSGTVEIQIALVRAHPDRAARSATPTAPSVTAFFRSPSSAP